MALGIKPCSQSRSNFIYFIIIVQGNNCVQGRGETTENKIESI
jgi:hypothetical protein